MSIFRVFPALLRSYDSGVAGVLPLSPFRTRANSLRNVCYFIARSAFPRTRFIFERCRGNPPSLLYPSKVASKPCGYPNRERKEAVNSLVSASFFRFSRRKSQFGFTSTKSVSAAIFSSFLALDPVVDGGRGIASLYGILISALVIFFVFGSFSVRFRLKLKRGC